MKRYPKIEGAYHLGANIYQVSLAETVLAIRDMGKKGITVRQILAQPEATVYYFVVDTPI